MAEETVTPSSIGFIGVSFLETSIRVELAAIAELSWNPVTLLANHVERDANPESVQFAPSLSCGLQFANRSHRVSAHRSMRRKVACCQRHCSQEHDDGNDGDRIVGSDSVQQPSDNACQSQRKRQSQSQPNACEPQ